MDWATVSKLLKEPLDKAHIKPPAPGKYGDYLEAWHVINEANRIFGFGGWGYRVTRLEETNRDLLTLTGQKGEYKQWRVGFMATVVVTVDGVEREGAAVGTGSGKPENLGDVIESAVKEAETDALKRALRSFGNPFGLALYDKSRANVEDTGRRLKIEERADEILKQIKTIADEGEYAGFADSIRTEVRDMNANGFAELAAHISAAMVTKKAELTQKDTA